MSEKQKKVVRVAYRIPQPELGKTVVGEDHFQKVLADRLRDLRIRRGAVQATVAKSLGTDTAGVSRLENGQTKMTAYQALVAANAFGVDIADLLRMELEASNDDSE